METIKGKWLFNETLTDRGNHAAFTTGDGVEFVSNNTIYGYSSFTTTSFAFEDNVGISCVCIYYCDSKEQYDNKTYTTDYLVYGPNSWNREEYQSGVWVDEAYRTIDFGTKEVTINKTFYDWFTANATKLQSEEDELYLIDESTLTEIADAIRTKKGITGNLDPANFASEILSIGQAPTTQTLTVINKNNPSETASFTMPSGMQFYDFINSEYNIDNVFTTNGVNAFYKEAELFWDVELQIPLTLDVGGGRVASGIFYYAGEAATQTLTVVNSNNEAETASFTMPRGYTFAEFFDSEYDTSASAFSVVLDPDELRYYVLYNSYLLTRDSEYAKQSDVASGTFYYEGEEVYTLSGTWVFNEDFNYGSLGYYYYPLKFRNLNVDYEGLVEDGDDYLNPPDSRGIWYTQANDLESVSTNNSVRATNRSGWINNDLRTISIEGTQTVSKEFYEWFTANAKPLISDLADTIWYIPAGWSASESYGQFKVSGYGDSYSLNTNYSHYVNGSVNIGYCADDGGKTEATDQMVFHITNPLGNPTSIGRRSYQDFSLAVTGGVDATNAQLIVWLYDNAVFQFTIEGTAYYAKAGMTWAEWVADTTLNTDGYDVQDDRIIDHPNNGVHTSRGVLLNDVTTHVSPTDTIIVGYSYLYGVGN